MLPAKKKWEILRPDPGKIDELVRRCSISPLLATLLVNRGITSPTEAQDYLSPTLSSMADPFLMKDMRKAADRIADAVENQEVIAAAVDMDCDGVTAGSILRTFFESLGVRSQITTPHRLTDGYGVHTHQVDTALKAGARVLVTADVGIAAHAAAEYSKAHGLDFIITDHHTPPQELPDAYAIVNPHQEGCRFPYKNLAGCGVAFFLVMAVRKVLRDRGYFTRRTEPDLRPLLTTVAIGTIGDLVELKGENRRLASFGLKMINSTSTSAGITALKNVSGLKRVSSGTVSYTIVPRLNSSGRMDSAERALELLTTSDQKEAATLATLLDGFNRERQELETQVVECACQMLAQDPAASSRKSIVLAGEWGEKAAAVVGISSSKLVEKFNRPTVLIAIDPESGIGKGSCRSAAGLNMYAALSSCSSLLLKWGGHKAAAGLSIETGRIDEFVEAFEAYVDSVLTLEDLQPVLLLDAEVGPSDLSLARLSELEKLEPYGMGNRSALFLLRGATVRNQRTLKEKHLKLTLEKNGTNVDAIGFNLAGSETYKMVDVAFSLDDNEWQGVRSVQLKLKDIRHAEA